MAYKVTVCGVDTNQLPHISKEESREILQEIAAGNNARRDYFLIGNLRLVLSIVHRFQYDPGLSDDVFQVGCIGLVKALNHFDPRHNVLFSTYAVPMIIGEIRRFLREGTALKVSRSVRDIAYKVVLAKQALRGTVDDPTLADVATYLGLELSEVVCALDAIADPISLDEPAFGDGDESALWRDQIADTHTLEESMLTRLDLQYALTTLSEREREVIHYRYYQGKTQTEISTITGVSQAQISRIESNAIKRLRTLLA